jgi:hypothetical protein
MPTMTKREHKSLLNQFERLSPAENAYVTKRITAHIYANPRNCVGGAISFCLETIPLSEPILFKVKEWVNEAIAKFRPEAGAHHTEEVKAYIAKVCGHCGKSENLKTCNRCGLTRYCGPECQKADWKKHKVTCRPAVPIASFSTPAGETHTLLAEGTHEGLVEVVESDQAAILAQFPGDYNKEDVAAIFAEMAVHGHSSAEARKFIEEAVDNGAKVVRGMHNVVFGQF